MQVEEKAKETTRKRGRKAGKGVRVRDSGEPTKKAKAPKPRYTQGQASPCGSIVPVRHSDGPCGGGVGSESESLSPFLRYFTERFPDDKSYFTHWDLDTIARDYLLWQPQVYWLQIYIIVNDCDNFDTHTHIGSVNWAYIRLLQHNGVIQGGPQDTKRASGHWTLAFYMDIPPFRNFTCDDIVSDCNRKRGLASRCEHMLQVAMELGASFKISKKLLDTGSKFFRQNVKDIVTMNFGEDELRGVLFDGTMDHELESVYRCSEKPSLVTK
jgi:hypothetical protein